MYSAYQLNKQGDNIQPLMYSFPNFEPVHCSMSSSTSWPAKRFLRRQVKWSGIAISFRIFQFVVIHTVKGFSIVTEVEVEGFLELSCFFYDSVDVGSLISGSFAFYKSSWYIWKFSIHVLYSLPCRILSITCICLYFSGDFFVVNCIWVLPLNWNVLNHLHLMHFLIQLDINLLSCCLFSLCPI